MNPQLRPVGFGEAGGPPPPNAYPSEATTTPQPCAPGWTWVPVSALGLGGSSDVPPNSWLVGAGAWITWSVTQNGLTLYYQQPASQPGPPFGRVYGACVPPSSVIPTTPLGPPAVPPPTRQPLSRGFATPPACPSPGGRGQWIPYAGATPMGIRQSLAAQLPCAPPMPLQVGCTWRQLQGWALLTCAAPDQSQGGGVVPTYEYVYRWTLPKPALNPQLTPR